MKAVPHPEQVRRIAAVRQTGALQIEDEPDFDDLTELASQICGTPVALITAIDATYQHFLSKVGTDLRGTDIESAICTHSLIAGDYLEIPDMKLDARTADNPLGSNPGVRFYAGAVLKDEMGMPLGTLCVLDLKPRVLTDFQRKALITLSKQAMKLILLRKALRRQEVLRNEIDHRVKNSLQAVTSQIALQRRSASDPTVKEALAKVEARVGSVAQLHEELYRSSADDQINLANFLGNVMKLLSVNLPEKVKVTSEILPRIVDSRRAAAIAVIVTECVSNSIRHAFAPGASGHISVTLGYSNPETLELICMDDGAGSAAGPGAQGGGLGLQVIEASAAQLDGAVDFKASDKGYVTRVTMPVASE